MCVRACVRECVCVCSSDGLFVKPAEPLNHEPSVTLVQDIEGSTSVSEHVEALTCGSFSSFFLL